MKREAGESGHGASLVARRVDFLNELSELHGAVVELGDRMAADYLAHAVACYAKRKDEAGEVWLRLGVERLRTLA